MLVDVLLYVERMPERGGDTLAREAVVTAGGGFNLLSAAARLGLPAAYAGRVGVGLFGEVAARDLAAVSVPVLLRRSSEGDTGFDVGLVEADGERTFVTSPGVEARLSSADLDGLPLEPGDAVYVSGYDLAYPVSGASLASWLPGLDAGCLLVFDPGPLVAEIPAARMQAALRRTDILSLNAREARLLAGSEDPSEVARRLHARLAQGAVLVVRAGADGCWASPDGRELLRVPPRPARVVDSTGAGDAHVAAMVARLAAGERVPEALWAANVAASMAVERMGPATCPSAEELASALAESAVS